MSAFVGGISFRQNVHHNLVTGTIMNYDAKSYREDAIAVKPLLF